MSTHHPSNNNTNESKIESSLAALSQAAGGVGGGGLGRHAERVKAKAKAGLATIGNALDKLNLPARIMEMEHDQEVADNLEVFNKEIKEEAERKRLVQEALARCKAEMEEHLSTFLFLNPEASYEEWIQDLHPENVSDGKLLQDFKDVDIRFYVVDSDHRLLWNERVKDPDRQVPARTYKAAHGLQPGDAPLDLLNNDHAFGTQQQQQPPKETAQAINAAESSSSAHGVGNENQSVDFLGDGWP